MSNHKDERDIEEILASLDAMLADSPPPPPTSETPEKVSVDDDSPRQRIVLTEDYLEPAARESIPLWAVQPQSKTHQAETKASPQEESVPSAMENETTSLEPETKTNYTDIEPEEESSIQGVVVVNHQDDISTNNHLEANTDALTLKVNSTDDIEIILDSTEEPETFDMSEAMNEDTLYDFEVLDHEFVKGFGQSTSPENSRDDKMDKTEAPVETNIDIETEADETIDDDEDEAKPLAEHIQTSVQEAVEQNDTITLNPDELDPIIEAISDDVRIKINQHLQQILPELISDALLEHLAGRDSAA